MTVTSGIRRAAYVAAQRALETRAAPSVASHAQPATATKKFATAATTIPIGDTQGAFPFAAPGTAAKLPPPSALRESLLIGALQLSRADAVIINAGAGFALESGIPDLRTSDGFKSAFPAFAEMGLTLQDLATPARFKTDPKLAWGFYGSRYKICLDAKPHKGYSILHHYSTQRKFPPMVVTTQIEGLFQRAGFTNEQIVEVHGSINHLQCLNPGCDEPVIRAADTVGRENGNLGVKVDRKTHTADLKTVPRCAKCGTLMRPNILMIGDSEFNKSRVDRQQAGFERYLQKLTAAADPDPLRLVVIEVGAGTTNPLLRNMSESLVRSSGGSGFLIRINPGDREHRVPNDVAGVGLQLKGEQAMELLDRQIKFGERMLDADDMYSDFQT